MISWYSMWFELWFQPTKITALVTGAPPLLPLMGTCRLAMVDCWVFRIRVWCEYDRFYLQSLQWLQAVSRVLVYVDATCQFPSTKLPRAASRPAAVKQRV